jgi:hypothetical protein
VGCSFGFGLWAWPLEASHYAWPKALLTIFYWLCSTHFFGLSTKFGHSIPRPLDLDGHSVKWPLVVLTTMINVCNMTIIKIKNRLVNRKQLCENSNAYDVAELVASISYT